MRTVWLILMTCLTALAESADDPVAPLSLFDEGALNGPEVRERAPQPTIGESFATYGTAVPRDPGDRERGATPIEIQSLVAELQSANAAEVAKALELVRKTGPALGTGSGYYSRAQVAMLAELGDWLRELGRRRERLENLRAFLEGPEAPRFVDEPKRELANREPASDKLDRLSLNSQRQPKSIAQSYRYLRTMSRNQLRQKAKELRQLMNKQWAEWNQVEGQLTLARSQKGADTRDLTYMASLMTQGGNGWFVQSLLYNRYQEEWEVVQRLLGE